MKIIKEAVFLLALIILSTVATVGQYVRVRDQHPCNETNSECDLSQENETPIFAQATVRREDVNISGIESGRLYS